MELFSSWTGSDFLQFYIMLLGLSAIAAWWIPAQLRPKGRASDPLDAEDLAVLGGGRERLADSLLADLFARGGLASVSAGKLEVVQPGLPTSPAGKALLAYGAPLSASAANRAVGVHAERVAARLRRSGLLLRPQELIQLRWLSIAPFCAAAAARPLSRARRQRRGRGDRPSGDPDGADRGARCPALLQGRSTHPRRHRRRCARARARLAPVQCPAPRGSLDRRGAVRHRRSGRYAVGTGSCDAAPRYQQ